MQILVHPGLHKTGSSSIQVSLNRFSLNSHLRKRQVLVSTEVKSLQKALSSSGREAPNWLLLSNESLFGEYVDFYEGFESKMQEFWNHTRPHEIREVTFFFRSYESWLGSCFSQLLHEGASATPLAYAEEFLRPDRKLFSDLVRSAQAVFGRETVSVVFLSGKEDAVEKISRKWSEVMGFDLGLTLPFRGNVSNNNLAALWMLAQMNQSELGKGAKYRRFIQNLETAKTGDYSLFPESIQQCLFDRQRIDALELHALLEGLSCVDEVKKMLQEEKVFTPRPYWEWPGDVPGIPELFAAATAASRLRKSRLERFKGGVVRVLGPRTVWVWHRLRQLISRSRVGRLE